VKHCPPHSAKSHVRGARLPPEWCPGCLSGADRRTAGVPHLRHGDAVADPEI